MSVLLVLSGLGLLYVGAEGLVRGSSSLALRFGVHPLIVGLTVVAFGTSAPELVVGIVAAIGHHGDVAFGNIVGSNTFNIAFILGVSALIYPLRIHLDLVRRDIPVMIVAAMAVVPILAVGGSTRTVGLILFTALVLYVATTVRRALRVSTADVSEVSEILRPPLRSVALDLLMLIAGIGVLVAGSQLLVSGSISIAQHFNISEAIIGLTIVAAGTSLPELATCVVAALKKESDIAVGNIVGSNIFNVFGILGITSIVSPYQVSGIGWVDGAVMIALSVVLLPLAFTDRLISRREGGLLMLAYIGYVYWLLP